MYIVYTVIDFPRLTLRITPFNFNQKRYAVSLIVRLTLV